MTEWRAGLLLRSYTKDPSQVSVVAARALKSVQAAHALKRNSGSDVFSTIIVLVPSDFDCGKTAEAVTALLAREGLDRAFVHTAHGYHSCEVLNEGVLILANRYWLDAVTVLSNKALPYLTQSVMDATFAALESGARIVGVAIDELADIVRTGRVQNTFTTWGITSLMEAQLFDSKIDVEEIAPTVRILRKEGTRIAVLEPEGKPLDIRAGTEAQARHEEVMAKKTAHQMIELDRLGASSVFLQGGIMPGYPKRA